jgi:hypothetical protein
MRRERTGGPTSGASHREVVGRVVVILVLLGALFAMAVHYDGARLDGTEHFLTKDALATNPDAYDGHRVYLWLDAARVTDGAVHTAPLAGAWSLTVETDDAVAAGDVIQVYGRFDAGERRVEAERVVVHDAGNRVRMYVVSALGGVLALGAFVRQWRPNRRRVAFVPRDATSQDGSTQVYEDGGTTNGGEGGG